jgi:hypothetical protein
MVIRPDNHSGMTIRAVTPEQAAVKARKYRSMAGAAEVEVRSFASLPAVRVMIAI